MANLFEIGYANTVCKPRLRGASDEAISERLISYALIIHLDFTLKRD
jgi:hypothetical protein